jgi:hypothetical protein
MTERYFITGVQLGLLKLAIEKGIVADETKKQLNKIEENQFIGNMKQPYEDYKIIIVKK